MRTGKIKSESDRVIYNNNPHNFKNCYVFLTRITGITMECKV